MSAILLRRMTALALIPRVSLLQETVSYVRYTDRRAAVSKHRGETDQPAWLLTHVDVRHFRITAEG
jgi:hypothetical protein